MSDAPTPPTANPDRRYADDLWDATRLVVSARQRELGGDDPDTDAWEALANLISEAVAVMVAHAAGTDLVADGLTSDLADLGLAVVVAS